MGLPAEKLTRSEREGISRVDRTDTRQGDTEQIEVSVTWEGQPRFTMILDWVLDNHFDAMVEAGTWRIYRCLVKCQNSTTKLSHPGVRLLREVAKCRRGDMRPKLDWLVERGLIRLVQQGRRRQADEYLIVQMPQGAKILKPDFSAPQEASLSAPRPQQANMENTAAETRKAESGPEPPGPPGSAQEGSFQEPQQTRLDCLDSPSNLAQHARHYSEQMRLLAKRFGKSWNVASMIPRMMTLCAKYREKDIIRAIEWRTPQANSPGLVYSEIENGLTKTEAAKVQRETQERLERIRAREAENRVNYAQTGTPDQLAALKHMGGKVREDIEKHPGPITQRGSLWGRNASGRKQERGGNAEFEAKILAEVRLPGSQTEAAAG